MGVLNPNILELSPTEFIQIFTHQSPWLPCPQKVTFRHIGFEKIELRLETTLGSPMPPNGQIKISTVSHILIHLLKDGRRTGRISSIASPQESAPIFPSKFGENHQNPDIGHSFGPLNSPFWGVYMGSWGGKVPTSSPTHSKIPSSDCPKFFVLYRGSGLQFVKISQKSWP